MALTSKLEGLLDSPTLPRDLISLLSSWRVGAWFCALNLILGSVLGITIYLAAIENEREFAELSQRLGLGQYSACMLLLGIAGLCTLLIPVRASGLFEGPRWARYFDQVVLSGISPERYFAGKVIAQNIFFVLVVIASLPYAVFSLSLGGTHASYIVLGLVSLWVYANLLTIVTICFAARVQEVGAAIGAIALFAFFFIMGLIPFPAYCGLITPAHYLMAPIYDVSFQNGGGMPWDPSRMAIPIGSAKVYIGSFGFFLIGAAFTCGLAGLFLLLGPVNCLIKANSTFGEVVMPGDNKRKGIFRLRLILRRRSEMSFFYENRPPWVTRWEAPLRYGATLAALCAITVIPFAILHHFTPKELSPEDFYIVNTVILCIALVVGASVFTCDRAIETTVVRCGRIQATAGAWDMVSFLLYVAFLLALVALVPAIRHALEGQKWFRNVYNLEDGLRLHRLVPFFVLLGLEAYAMVRLCGCKLWDRSRAVLSTAIMLGALWTIPFVMAIMVVDHGVFNAIESWASAISVLSPIPYIIFSVDESVHGELRSLRDMNWESFIPFLHALFTALLALAAYRAHFRLKRALAREQEAS